MKLFIGIILLLFVHIACIQTAKKETWPEKMQDLGELMSEVVPLVFSKVNFENPQTRNESLAKLKALRDSSHNVSVKEAKKLLGDDPIVEYSLNELQTKMDEAITYYEEGKLLQAQRMFKSSISYCYYCHTRSNFGPQFQDDLFKINLASIPNIFDRVHFLIAARRYEEAFTTIQNKIFSSDSNNFSEELRLIRLYLQIGIKSGKTETALIRDLDKYLDKKSPPRLSRDEIRSWRRSLVNWRGWKNSIPEIEEQRRKMREQKSYADLDMLFVDHVYLSNYLHDLLMRGNDNKSEIYFDLGWIYNRYPEMQLWDLSEVYYTACIMNSPKTDIAKSCYQNLEESIKLGYTGSAGIYVPRSEQVRLRMLRAKAGVN